MTLVPDAMSTEVDLVPVPDMVPLDFLPPLSLPSEADLLQLLHASNPVRSRTEKQGALRKAAVKKEERNVSFSK